MSLSLQQAQKLSMGELSGISALELMYVQAEAANYLRNAKELKDWIDGAIALKYDQHAQRYFYADSHARRPKYLLGDTSPVLVV
jgi:hypothetical protein